MPNTSSARPDVQTPNVDGMRNEKRDFNSDAKGAPKAPKMSGSAAPNGNDLQTPADLREAGMPKEPMSTDEPRKGRSD